MPIRISGQKLLVRVAKFVIILDGNCTSGTWDHDAHYYNEGYSAEMLAEEFPTLPLSLIHKAIAFYLDNRADVNAYVDLCTEELDRQQAAAKRGPSLAELRKRLESMRAAESK